MQQNKDKLDAIRKFIYAEPDRRFVELTRDHVEYLKGEATYIGMPREVVLYDKLRLLKILFQTWEELKKLNDMKVSENNAVTEDADAELTYETIKEAADLMRNSTETNS